VVPEKTNNKTFAVIAIFVAKEIPFDLNCSGFHRSVSSLMPFDSVSLFSQASYFGFETAGILENIPLFESRDGMTVDRWFL